jgi:predicted nucleic-acid-binding protein
LTVVRAIDTNIIVRFVTNDDPDQSERARQLVLRNTLFVPITVLLEAEWVLRSVYQLDRASIATALRKFVGLETVHVQHATEVAQALDHATAGMDLADALHLVLAGGCTDFVSFDRPLSRKAAALSAMPIVEP